MSKVNLYIYPQARDHVQDSMRYYKHKVPFGKAGIEKHCNITTDIDKADLFYMGQMNADDANVPLNFEYLEKWPEKHVVDLEGDFNESNVPPPLPKEVLKTMATATNTIDWGNLVPRMAMSHVAWELSQNKEYIPDVEDKQKKFFFRGQYNHPLRGTLKNIEASNPPFNIEVTLLREWGGQVDLEDGDSRANMVDPYHKSMKAHLLSLCPRGVGMGSVRFYESCYFGCVPIIIGFDTILGDPWYDTSFIFRIDPTRSPEQIKEELHSISKEPLNLLRERGLKARVYYNEVVLPYMEDPTKYFLDTYKNNMKVINE